MKGFRLSIGACLGLAISASLVHAQPQCGCYYPPIPQAPDACGPGFFWTNNCGMTYGPSHCLRPPYPPFQGMVPGPPPPRCGPDGRPCGPGGPGGPGPGGPYGSPNAPCGPDGSPIFGTHPYARSPRDFFMYYDKDEPSYTGIPISPVPPPFFQPR